MKDASKTKQALTEELASLRRRIQELEQSEAERKKAALKELQTSEEKYQMLVEGVSDVLFEIDHQGVVLYFSPVGKVIWEYDQADVIGKNFIEFVHQDDRELAIKRFQELVAGMEYPLTFRIKSKSGKYIWARTKTKPRMENGRFMGASGILTDITDQKQAEEALRESEALLQSLIDYMHDAMIILNWDGSILFANRAAALIIEFERPEEFVGHNMLEYLHPDSLQKAAEDLEAVKADKMGFRSEYQLFSVTGRRIWVESIGGNIIFRNASANLVCIRDITERKQAEEELLRTLESLRKAVGATIQVMVSAVEARDPYTAGHQIRSADLARTIATEMGLPQGKIDAIRIAGSIHDIGKLSIPAEILSKPTNLSEIEFSLIKEHAQSGYEMLKDVESPWPLAEIVYQHHERMNGSGYPRNLKGNEILMESRILAVADVVEAMASHRPYRPTLGIEAALEEIEKNKGILYDDAVADACLRLFREKGYQLI